MAKRKDREGQGATPPATEDREVLSLQVEELDVRSIMDRIEERVEKRRREGLYRDLPLLELEEERTGGVEPHMILDPLQELIFLLQVARQYADVDSHYPIGARRSPLGPVILLTKKVIRRFMTPYMDAVFSKQRQFNAQCMRSLEALLDLIVKERERSYRGGLDRYTAWVEMELKEDVGALLAEAVRHFPPQRRVVNLYCGTGDFLAAAGEAGLETLGVEEDPRLVRLCQERGARVVQADPLDYLGTVPEGSMGAVFLPDAGERGDLRELLWMVTTLGDKMEKDGLAVALNHNPRSAWGVEEAFQDPSLLRMVHPETLTSLFCQAGFQDVQVTLVGEFSPQEVEKAYGSTAGLPQPEYDNLAELLFAPRRYMLWARR